MRDARDYLLKLRGASYGDLDRKFFFAPKGGEYALPEAREELDETIDAILDGRVLRFAYRHNDGREENLSVRPLTLVIFNQQFYVLALRADGSTYCYRFARMSNVDATSEAFEYPTKNQFDPQVVFGPSFGIHIALPGPVEDVEVVVSGPWANFATSHRWHPSQQVELRSDGTVLVKLRVRVCPEVQSWVLGFGEHAEVLRPQSLRKQVAARIEKAAMIYPRSGPRVAKAGRDHPRSGRGSAPSRRRSGHG